MIFVVVKFKKDAQRTRLFGCPLSFVHALSICVRNCFMFTVVCNTKVPNHVFVRFYYDTIAVGDSFPRIGLEQ